MAWALWGVPRSAASVAGELEASSGRITGADLGRDLGKIGAQAHDGLLEIPRWTQRFDAGCHLTQLFLQAANIDRRFRRGLRSGERSAQGLGRGNLGASAAACGRQPSGQGT